MDRFWQKVEKSDGCWIWLAARRPTGYGQFFSDGLMRHAHRVAWELTYGPIPAGSHVLHRCDCPPCVRPDHLFLGDQAANNADRNQKGRNPMTARTHCPQGHPYNEINTFVNRAGARQCRICNREKLRQRRALRKIESPV